MILNEESRPYQEAAFCNLDGNLADLPAKVLFDANHFIPPSAYERLGASPPTAAGGSTGPGSAQLGTSHDTFEALPQQTLDG